MINKRIQRSVPYIRVLANAKNKVQMLKSFPKFVIDDIIEVIINIVFGNVKLSRTQKTFFIKRKKSVVDILDKVNKRKKRTTLIYSQKGGFIAGLIPILASVIAGAFDSAL